MRTRLAALVVVSLTGLAPWAAAQSTAINGTIEGVVKDTTGAVLSGATVTVTNVEMGAQRTITTDSNGGFRATLLPLGTYKVRVELPSFKSVERTGVSLSAGQTAVFNFALEVGGVEEVVSVTGDLPVAQPGKIDLGRTISESEIKNLPLVSRNPYNFAFLQANVTGYENQEFGVPRINANGTQMHTNYQIDGNTNTQKDRAGLRLLPISEVVVREVKVITSGFAPEFGQTTGMVYNAVTPSGTNAMHGYLTYRYRRAGMTERPFFLAPAARKPDNNIDNFNATLGGPIVPDKWHYYVGYEFVDQDLRDASKVIQQSAINNAQRLGLSPTAIPPDGVIPTAQKVNFGIAKTDYQLSPEHKLSARYLFFKNRSPYNIGGGINTVDRASDFNDRMDSASVQLISSFGGSRLNELRVQFARRHQFRTASEDSGTCPAILVTGIAAFGCPLDGTQAAGFDFNQKIWQVSDNFTWIRGRHSFKAGIDLQFIADDRVNTLRQIYTFPTVDAYLSARSGATPRSYTTFQQDLGDPTVSYSSGFHGVFIQDELRMSPAFKLLFGIRYDLFAVPDSRPYGSNPLSQSFKTDKNNFAPRVGFSWSVDKAARTVVRASTGIMYEPPLLNFYEDAILRNGDPRSALVNLNPTSAGAPAFPAILSSGTLPAQANIAAMAADFSTQWALMTNVQLERALTNDLSLSLGYVNSLGRSMPVLIDTNLIPTALRLADGRPIYSTAVNASTRVNPAFNHIDTFSSTGEGSYNAFTLMLNKRMSHGVQMQASYTWAEGEDDAPLTSTYVVAGFDDRLSDPSNQGRDKGDVPFNQTHTFVMSTLLAPQVQGTSFWSRLADNNQLGLILTWNSGLPFNIRSNLDLNLDGVTSDRPIGIDRNTGRLGTVFNLDLRYQRFIPLGPRFKAELFLEAKNVFNTGCSDPAEYATCSTNVQAVNRVVTTNAAGQPTTGIPDPFPGTNGYQQRQVQLGVKLSF